MPFDPVINTSVWQKFDDTFKGVGAILILQGGKPVARVLMQHREQLRTWFHVYGFPVVASNWSRGYGYDKHTSTIQDALEKLAKVQPADKPSEAADATRRALVALGPLMEASTWKAVLERSGFDVVSVL